MPYSVDEQYTYDAGNSKSVRAVGRHAAAAANTVTSTANAAGIITYAAAAAGVSHVISGVAVSYTGGTTAGSLKIEDGSGTTVFFQDISAVGVTIFTFNPPMKGTAATAMIITAAAGGAGVTSKISVLGKWTE